MEEKQKTSKEKKSSSFVGTIFLIAFVYLVVVQPLISLFFQKDIVSSETVLVKVEKRESGNFDLGLLSKYKFKYTLQVIDRDGWIGYIRHIYSNKELKAGLKYGLEICPVECDSWFEYFFVPSIWSHYSFDISEIYNNNPELKNINFQTENNDKLFDIIESKYSMWKGSSGD
jgi:hypothetical protein